MVWEIITTYSDPIMLPALTLLVLAGIIGLICSRSRRHFYIWVLQTTIKLSLFSCGLLICYAVAKYGLICFNTSIAGNETIFFLTWFWSVMGSAFLYLLISLIALIAITIAEIKRRYSPQPPSDLAATSIMVRSAINNSKNISITQK